MTFSEGPALPVDALYGLGVVVDDLDKVLPEFSRFFGIATWNIRRLKSGVNLTMTGARGEIAAESLWATGGNGVLRFDIVQPVSGATCFQRFLDDRGPGMLDMATHVLTPQEFEAALPRLAREGVGILETLRISETLTICYLDTVDQLGTLVKIFVCSGAEPFEGVPVDRTQTFTMPPPGERLPIDAPYHVCVLTRHRRLSIRENFRQIFGIEDWFEYDNEVGRTSENTHYHGKPVEAGRFKLALGRRARFAVEVVEYLYGPNVYDDVLRARGEGIHHVMTTISTTEHLAPVTRALAQDGYSVIMDGSAGSIYYGYLAAEGKMANLAVEILTVPDDVDVAAEFGPDRWAILTGAGF